LKALAHKGFDMKEKYKIAVDHFSAAANCGHPFAKFQLGMMCQFKNPERAKGFFDCAKPDLEILAAEGNGEAKECLKYLMDNDANRGDN
jgi:TPR repeat protein